MKSNATICFVCLHGSAKSLIAAKLGEHLAARRGLPMRFLSAGIEPDAGIPSHVVAGLRQDGVDVSAVKPRHATADALSGTSLVVSFGPDVKAIAPAGAEVEVWTVPDVSDGYPAARDAIRNRVENLLRTF